MNFLKYCTPKNILITCAVIAGSSFFALGWGLVSIPVALGVIGVDIVGGLATYFLKKRIDERSVDNVIKPATVSAGKQAIVDCYEFLLSVGSSNDLFNDSFFPRKIFSDCLVNSSQYVNHYKFGEFLAQSRIGDRRAIDYIEACITETGEDAIAKTYDTLMKQPSRQEKAIIFCDFLKKLFNTECFINKNAFKTHPIVVPEDAVHIHPRVVSPNFNQKRQENTEKANLMLIDCHKLLAQFGDTGYFPMRLFSDYILKNADGRINKELLLYLIDEKTLIKTWAAFLSDRSKALGDNLKEHYENIASNESLEHKIECFGDMLEELLGSKFVDKSKPIVIKQQDQELLSEQRLKRLGIK